MSYFVACCSVLWSCFVSCLFLFSVLIPRLLFSRPGYLTGLGSLQLKVSRPGYLTGLASLQLKVSRPGYLTGLGSLQLNVSIMPGYLTGLGSLQLNVSIMPGYLTGLGSLQLKVSSPSCSGCCLISSVLIDCCCSISFVLQPNFVQVWLQLSSCYPADCPFLPFGLSHQPCLF